VLFELYIRHEQIRDFGTVLTHSVFNPNTLWFCVTLIRKIPLEEYLIFQYTYYFHCLTKVWFVQHLKPDEQQENAGYVTFRHGNFCKAREMLRSLGDDGKVC